MNNKFDIYNKKITTRIVLLLLIILLFYCNSRTLHELNISVNYKQKPIIWLFWQNKKGKKMPQYLQLCLDTIYKKCGKDFEINLLDEKTVYNFIPDLRKDLDDLRIAQKSDYIRIKLLHKYGGIWLDVDTIVMSNLLPVIKKLETYDFVGFGCTGIYCDNGYPYPSNQFIAARKNSILMKNVLIELDRKLDIKTKDYEYYDLGKKVLWNELNKLRSSTNYDYFHYSSEYDGSRLKNKRWIRPEYYFKKNNELLDENKLLVVFLANNPIMNCPVNRKLFDKFLKLSKKEILKQDYWIAQMFRKALSGRK